MAQAQGQWGPRTQLHPHQINAEIIPPLTLRASGDTPGSRPRARSCLFQRDKTPGGSNEGDKQDLAHLEEHKVWFPQAELYWVPGAGQWNAGVNRPCTEHGEDQGLRFLPAKTKGKAGGGTAICPRALVLGFNPATLFLLTFLAGVIFK